MPTGREGDGRPDFGGLFQKLADTLVRLLGERFELAKIDLRDEAERLLVVLAHLSLFAIAAGVGIVMLALAATDLLAPLVPSHALRLALVGGALLSVGAVRARAIARAGLSPQPLAGPEPEPEPEPGAVEHEPPPGDT